MAGLEAEAEIDVRGPYTSIEAAAVQQSGIGLSRRVILGLGDATGAIVADQRQVDLQGKVIVQFYGLGGQRSQDQGKKGSAFHRGFPVVVIVRADAGKAPPAPAR
ncbi:hypothetical protein D9M73_197470 [compost metagenome]